MAAAYSASLAVSAWAVASPGSLPLAPWLTWGALLPLLLAVRVLPPVRAACAGAIWGIQLYVLFGVAGAAYSSLTGPQALALLLSVPAIYAGLGSLFTRTIGFSPFALVVGWALVEIAMIPLGLAGGLLGGFHAESTCLHWLARLLGYAFAAFVVALLDAALLSVLFWVDGGVPRRWAVAEIPDCRPCPEKRTSLFIRSWHTFQVHPRAPPVQTTSSQMDLLGRVTPLYATTGNS